jgi:hypothetical protein
LLLIAVIAAVCAWVVWPKSRSSLPSRVPGAPSANATNTPLAPLQDSASSVTTASPPAKLSAPLPSPPPENPSTPPQPAVSPALAAGKSNSTHAAELARIEELATTYAAEQVQPLARYLQHESPAVRAAAVDGLVRLGDSSAAPLLRAAAKQMDDPDETVAMLNAAKYLELPSLPPEAMKQLLKKARTKASSKKDHAEKRKVGNGSSRQ